jgi:hypothetical protein
MVAGPIPVGRAALCGASADPQVPELARLTVAGSPADCDQAQTPLVTMAACGRVAPPVRSAWLRHLTSVERMFDPGKD